MRAIHIGALSNVDCNLCAQYDRLWDYVAVNRWILTALDHHRADLSIVRIGFELHRAGEHQCQSGIMDLARFIGLYFDPVSSNVINQSISVFLRWRTTSKPPCLLFSTVPAIRNERELNSCNFIDNKVWQNEWRRFVLFQHARLKLSVNGNKAKVDFRIKRKRN